MESFILSGEIDKISQYNRPLTDDIMDRVIFTLWHNGRDIVASKKILSSIDCLLKLDKSISVLIVNSWFNTLDTVDAPFVHTYISELTNRMIDLGKESIDMEVYISYIKNIKSFPHKDLGEILEQRTSWETK